MMTESLEMEYAKRIEFGLTYDKDKLICRSKAIYVITKCKFPYKTFSFYSFNDILSQMLEVMYQGYIPRIEVADVDGENAFGKWFRQPFENELREYEGMEVIRTDERIQPVFGPWYDSPFKEHELILMCRLYNDWLTLNDRVNGYVADEYSRLVRNKKVLGVLYRGTDFTGLKLNAHPIQPSLDDILLETEKAADILGSEYIYLASEDREAELRFREKFGGMIIVNKRRYIDEEYKSAVKRNDRTRLDDLIPVQNDGGYEQALSYLSSVVLLSVCDGLVAGNCGGSDAAIYFNDRQYKLVKLFELGYY